MARAKRNLVIAPNDDGLGTAAWAVRLVKELVRQGEGRIHKIILLVASERLAAFHADKHPGAPIEVVRLEPVRSPIRLVKSAGGVDVAATLEGAVRPYADSRGEYQRALAACGVLDQADVVVDLGVPQLALAVRDENRRRAAAGRPSLSAVTLHDHCWSRTLREMAAARGLLTDAAAAALDQMRQDEALTPEVILFPEPVAPEKFLTHWREALGVPGQRLPGVLGGPRWTERWAGGEPRRSVRMQLGITDELPVLHVSGGGTTVWDDVLPALLDEYLAQPPRYHVVVFSPAEARRRGLCLRRERAVELARHPACPRLVFLGNVAGETHHPLFAGFDLVLARAGGGTVNDAIACRAPMVLIEERDHWQVEQIREACRRMGLCRAATLEEFRRLGRRLVETPEGGLIPLDAERARMEAIPNHGEQWLARRLLGPDQGQA